jgi:dTMP kinase
MHTFIVFEGCDGSGKSSVIKGIFKHLLSNDISATVLRDPGSTNFNIHLRELLFQHPDLTDYTKLLLFRAMREELVDKAIAPQLANGNVVLCDRYTLSTLVYQGVLGGLEWQIEQLEPSLEPDIIVLLDVSPEVAVERLSARIGQNNFYDDVDLDTRRQMRAAYLHLASENPDRYIVIDANQPYDTVVSEIITKLAFTGDARA